MNNEFYDVARQNFDDFVNAQQKLMKGIEVLSQIEHPEGAVTEKTKVLELDKNTLYHYKPRVKRPLSTPTLISYALVNRYYMMDLQHGTSFIENLLDSGLDLYVLDWGYPTKDDMYLTMEDYILGYIDDAVDYILETTESDKLNFMGICQGGTFATIYTALRPDKVKNLITLVTPIDFSTNDKLLFKWGKHVDINPVVDAYGVIPGEFMNNMFLLLSPITLTTNKYLRLIDNFDDPDAMTNFLNMEKWIFDSPGQAGETLRQFNNDLYVDNKLIKGELKIGDEVVDLKNIEVPLMNIYATRDDQVPNAASKPLTKLVGSKDTAEHAIETGHIGLFVSRRSVGQIVPLISDWLKDRE